MTLRETLNLIIHDMGAPLSGDFLASPAPVAGYWIGRDGSGNCILLVPPEPLDSPQLKLEHIEYVPQVRVSIEKADGGEPPKVCGVVSLIGFEDRQSGLEATILAAIISEAGEDPQKGMVYAAVQRLANRFSAAQFSNRRTQIGLWGELLILYLSEDVERMALSWLSSPDSVTDFFSEGVGLEVKTTQSSARVHHFSLGQLNMAAKANIWVVSLVVQSDPLGSSVGDLLELIMRRLDRRPDLQSHVAARIFATYDEGEGSILRFDLDSARNSVWLVPFLLVPKISVDSEVISAQWATTLPGPISRKVLMQRPNSLGVHLMPG